MGVFNAPIFKFNMDKKVLTQYSCAVILIISSIILAFVQSICNDEIDSSILMYIAQAFLLAASIFGLDYYVRKLMQYVDKKESK